MAEFLLKKMAADRGFDGWQARSAGVAAERYFPVPQEVHRALKEKGIHTIEHTPQLIGRDLLAWADAILPMTHGHLDHLLDQFPEFSAKTELFSKFTGLEEKDIEDPIGQSDTVYAACRDEIEDGLGRLLDHHAAKKS